MNMRLTKKLIKKVRSAFYFGLPVFIFYYIFKYVDVSALITGIKNANLVLLTIALLCSPLLIMTGAWRWNVIMASYSQQSVPLRFCLKHYWIGLPLGLFVPGSLGWDGYRVLVSGHQFGGYIGNVVAVVLEKFIALFVSVFLIVALYPFLSFTIESAVVDYVLITSYGLFCCGVLMFLGLVLLPRIEWVKRILLMIERRILAMINNILCRLKRNTPEHMKGLEIRLLIRPWTDARQLIAVLSLSMLVMFLSAVASQLYFLTLGYDISFLVNLFVQPVFYFAFLLPITIGSFGVREAVAIFVYGLFGVPAEIALSVAFFSLLGHLLNNLLGGLVMLNNRGSLSVLHTEKK